MSGSGSKCLIRNYGYFENMKFVRTSYWVILGLTIVHFLVEPTDEIFQEIPCTATLWWMSGNRYIRMQFYYRQFRKVNFNVYEFYMFTCGIVYVVLTIVAGD